jgi:hypothetical protein
MTIATECIAKVALTVVTLSLDDEPDTMDFFVAAGYLSQANIEE